MTAPRGPRKAQEIFAATLALLAEHGYDGLTIEAAAAKSGVNKTTIYRWWPSKDALLAAALTESRALELDVPDTGALRDDLRALVTQIMRLLTTPPVSHVAAAAMSTHRPELSAVIRAFFADRMAQERPIFTRATTRGELRPDADPVAIMDLLGGALWFRIHLRGAPADDGYLDDIVNLVLSGART